MHVTQHLKNIYWWLFKDMRACKRFAVDPDSFFIRLPRKTPTMFFDVYIRAGALSEPRTQAGIGHILEHYLAALIDQQLPHNVDHGAKINDDDIVFYLESDDQASLVDAAESLLRTLRNPDFSRDDVFAYEKQSILNELEEEKNDVRSKLERLVEQTRYTDEPDQRSFVDHLPSMRGLSLTDIERYHARIVTKDTVKTFYSATHQNTKVQQMTKDALHALPLPSGHVAFPKPNYSDLCVVLEDSPDLAGVYAALTFPSLSRTTSLHDRLTFDLLLALLRDTSHVGLRQLTRTQGIYDLEIIQKQGIYNGYIALQSHLSTDQLIHWTRTVLEFLRHLKSNGPERDAFRKVKRTWLADMVVYWRSNQGRFAVLTEHITDAGDHDIAFVKDARAIALALNEDDILDMAQTIFDGKRSNMVCLGKTARQSSETELRQLLLG